MNDLPDSAFSAKDARHPQRPQRELPLPTDLGFEPLDLDDVREVGRRRTAKQPSPVERRPRFSDPLWEVAADLALSVREHVT
jgi:hypothetical protein